MPKFRMSVECPRWAKFPSFIKSECFMNDFTLSHIDIDKGFIREKVNFEVTGEDGKKLERFYNELLKAFEKWNH